MPIRSSMAHKRLIIPIFIPFGGCPHKCVFCDQEGISAAKRMPTPQEVSGTIELYLSTWKGNGIREAAFYGGSFTGLPESVQKEYLDAAAPYLKDGRLDALRLSTRPDYINSRICDFLKERGVATVELGVQSMDEHVLHLSGRGHGPDAAVQAVRVLKEAGLKVGLQFMPGLPGDTRETVIETTKRVIALAPDFVRVYPSIVLKDTALHRMYLSGRYTPWPLDEMVSVCVEVKRELDLAGIPVIRMGLQPTKELESSIAAGPYHPSFRQLVAAAS